MRDYSLYRNNNGQAETGRNFRKPKILIIIFFGLISLFLVLKLSQNYLPLSLKKSKPENNQSGQKTNTLSDNGLITSIEKEISTTSGTFSVYVYDINNKKDYGLHEQTIISAASINKIPILAALYYLAGKNELDLEKIIIPQPKDIQNYGSGSIQYDPSGTPYSLKTLARLMMEKSDNTAAYILASLVIGMDKIQTLVDGWGLTQTRMIDNKTSAKDMSVLLIKMYKGEITSPSLTSEMLGFMEKSDYDDRLPQGIPEGIKIYHKTGDAEGVVSDVGIIKNEHKLYYLGILTTDVGDKENLTKKTISEISEMVYKY